MNLRSLILADIENIFPTNASPEATLTQLQGLNATLFAPFDPNRHPADLWIRRVWETGDTRGYQLCQNALPFPTAPSWEISPLAVTLGENCPDEQAAFLYLFTNRNVNGQHWNCSSRRGGHDAFPNDQSKERINEKFEEIRNINAPPEHEVSPAMTLTVMRHLVWPYVFPVWYKGTEGGYSQIDGMQRLLRDVDYLSKGAIRPKEVLDLRGNYSLYSSVYRIFLWLYKQWITPPPEPHFDFFTQFLAELIPVTNALDLLKTKKALILYGVPGTGKTYEAKQLAKCLNKTESGEDNDLKKDESPVNLVQFHPGYSYADFIIGIRPGTTADGQVTYQTTKGVLYEIAERAVQSPGQNFCLIIDEINRSNLAEVLGEAMYCLEYRGDENKIQLPQIIEKDMGPFSGGKEFFLPANLYVIGTMNHADRSISGFDMALRRRFAWFKMKPMTWLERHLKDKSFDLESLQSFIDAAAHLNTQISNGTVGSDKHATRIPLNADHQIGDSYFAAIVSIVGAAVAQADDTQNARRILPQHRETLWLYYLRPLLEDYLGNDVHNYQDALSKLGEQFIGN